MYIYAGIDEAGYGPMFGPLLIGRAVLALEDLPADAAPPNLWQCLRKAVCSDVAGRRKGRIAVNDSKKLYTPSAGLKHLELGVLTFAALAGQRPVSVDAWLDCLGECCHRDLTTLPWYAPSSDWPWGSLPCACTAGEIAVAHNLLALAAAEGRVRLLDVGAAVVLEDRFNRMVAATRSKAAASFTFVAAHLQSIWQRFGDQHPTVVVDRQSGRTHYRELLALTFPEARLTILEETPQVSAYQLDALGSPSRGLRVSFQVEAEAQHLPVALASMVSKYTRELFMARFQAYFHRRCPQIKPTAGYATDAQRFWREIQPRLGELGLDPKLLRRRC